MAYDFYMHYSLIHFVFHDIIMDITHTFYNIIIRHFPDNVATPGADLVWGGVSFCTKSVGNSVGYGKYAAKEVLNEKIYRNNIAFYLARPVT